MAQGQEKEVFFFLSLTVTSKNVKAMCGLALMPPLAVLLLYLKVLQIKHCWLYFIKTFERLLRLHLWSFEVPYIFQAGFALLMDDIKMTCSHVECKVSSK